MRPRKHRTPEEMYPLIRAYLENGKTQNRFCQDEGLSKTTFQYWLRKYRDRQDTEHPVEFTSLQVEADRDVHILIRCKNGTEIHIPL